jgi:hypothetical protein
VTLTTPATSSTSPVGCVTIRLAVNDLEDAASALAVVWEYVPLDLSQGGGVGGPVPSREDFVPLTADPAAPTVGLRSPCTGTANNRTCTYDMCGFRLPGLQWLGVVVNDTMGGAARATLSLPLSSTLSVGQDIVIAPSYEGPLVIVGQAHGAIVPTSSNWSVTSNGVAIINSTVTPVGSGQYNHSAALNVTLLTDQWVELKWRVVYQTFGARAVTVKVRRNVAPTAVIATEEPNGLLVGLVSSAIVTVQLPVNSVTVSAALSRDDFPATIAEARWTLAPVACSVPNASLGAVPPGDVALYCQPETVVASPWNASVPLLLR